MEDQLEGFQTIFDINRKDVVYSDKCFNEVIVNFVGVEVSYSRCHSSFPSKLKLHQHIKAGCRGKGLPSSSTQLSLSILVIASMTIN